jgi:hypothetical protein
MLAKRHFDVLVLGVSEREQRILRTAFLISQGRAHAYALAGDPPLADPDVLIVNGDSEQALARRAAYERWRTAPVLSLGAGDRSCARSAVAPRPLAPTQLVALLDGLTRRFVTSGSGLVRRPPATT